MVCFVQSVYKKMSTNCRGYYFIQILFKDITEIRCVTNVKRDLLTLSYKHDSTNEYLLMRETNLLLAFCKGKIIQSSHKLKSFIYI